MKSDLATAIVVCCRMSAISASSNSPWPNFLAAASRSQNPAAYSGMGTQWRRNFCGNDLSNKWVFSFNMPGTNHAQRAAET